MRMTKPDFVSSHDWHVQLCCQRSELLPPKRAVLDQGLSQAYAITCVLELDGAVFVLIYFSRTRFSPALLQPCLTARTESLKSL